MKFHLPTWSEFVALFMHGGKVSNIIAAIERQIEAMEHCIQHNLNKADDHHEMASMHLESAEAASQESARAARVKDNLSALVG